MKQPVAVIGIDPGGRNSAVVARNGSQVLSARVIVRKGDDELPGADYLHELTGEITERVIELENAGFTTVIAVEGLVAPSPHMGMISVVGILGTALALGAILQEFPEAHVVPPGKNGSLPEAAYPVELRKGARLGGPSIHARAAHDVAGGGLLLARAKRR